MDDELMKPSRAERWKRSVAARIRRQVARFAKQSHEAKKEREDKKKAVEQTT